MSVFLTPELEPFFGATYFPPSVRDPCTSCTSAFGKAGSAHLLRVLLVLLLPAVVAMCCP